MPGTAARTGAKLLLFPLMAAAFLLLVCGMVVVSCVMDITGGGRRPL